MEERLRAMLRTWRFLWNHPLASRHRVASLERWLRWQVGARLVGSPVVVPFVGETHLLVRPGMTGATGSVYAGLQEFEEMAFALHLLRPHDLFVDVGANVGTYTVLAAGCAGARCIAVEPIPSTYRDLVANIRLNELESRVRAVQCGLAAEPGQMSFTADGDTVNHVLVTGESTGASVPVVVTTLDHVVDGESPAMVKVDVEGFETKVFEGAEDLLSRRSLIALIVELNGSGNRYGFDEAALVFKFQAHGFRAYEYQPFTRTLRPRAHGKNMEGGNTLFIRDIEAAAERVRTGPRYSIHGVPV